MLAGLADGGGIHVRSQRSASLPPPVCPACLQRTSQELDSIWRMSVVRQNLSKRDVWKRRVAGWGRPARLRARRGLLPIK